MNTAYRMPAFFVRLCVFSTHPYFEKTNLFKFFKIEGGTVLPLMACKVSLQSLLATLIAISVANNGNDSAQVAGRCIAYVRPATRIPSALLHVVPMPAWEQRKLKISHTVCKTRVMTDFPLERSIPVWRSRSGILQHQSKQGQSERYHREYKVRDFDSCLLTDAARLGTVCRAAVRRLVTLQCCVSTRILRAISAEF